MSVPTWKVHLGPQVGQNQYGVVLEGPPPLAPETHTLVPKAALDGLADDVEKFVSARVVDGDTDPYLKYLQKRAHSLK